MAMSLIALGFAYSTPAHSANGYKWSSCSKVSAKQNGQGVYAVTVEGVPDIFYQDQLPDALSGARLTFGQEPNQKEFTYEHSNGSARIKFTNPDTSYYFELSCTVDLQMPMDSCATFEGEVVGSYYTDQNLCLSYNGRNCQSTCFQGGVCISNNTPDGENFLHYITPQSCDVPNGDDFIEPCQTEDCTGGGDNGGGDGDGGGDSGGDNGGGDGDGGGDSGGDNGGGDGDGGGDSGGDNGTGDNWPDNYSTEQGQGEIVTAVENLQTETEKITDSVDGIEGQLDGIREQLEWGGPEQGEAAAEGVALPDLSESGDIVSGHNDTLEQINEAISEDAIQGLSPTSYDSIPQLFAKAADNCTSVNLLGMAEFNPCGKFAQIRTFLEWVVAVLFILFIIYRLDADIKKVRLT
ncbi:hypothetical protein [Pseudoalteromonas ruthenica]|uniref:hypothetical protein n=1 Tax=Pseudoalteromonas ruthenica TaxID=151081 RepID=UPI0015D17632|nr:hypothetical protein [Pseudoalteromonas ruthenica]